MSVRQKCFMTTAYIRKMTKLTRRLNQAFLTSSLKAGMKEFCPKFFIIILQ